VKSPGAQYGGLRERDVCRDIVDFASPLFEARGHVVVDPRTDEEHLSYPEYLLRRIATLTRYEVDVAIDVHLNAWSSPPTNYSLVLYGVGRDDSLALATSVAFSFDVLGWDNMGAKADAAIGRTLGFCRRLTCPAIVVEPLFLSNAEARHWLAEEKGRERLAALLVEGVQSWIENPSSPVSSFASRSAEVSDE